MTFRSCGQESADGSCLLQKRVAASRGARQCSICLDEHLVVGTVALREEALPHLLCHHSCSLSLSQRLARDASRDHKCGPDRAAEAAARVHQLSQPNLTAWSLRFVVMGVAVGLLATGWFWLVIGCFTRLIVCDKFDDDSLMIRS